MSFWDWSHKYRKQVAESNLTNVDIGFLRLEYAIQRLVSHWVQGENDPPPLKSTWDFGFLKVELPPKTFWNKLNMKSIGTKAINMSDIMVYLAMFSTTSDKIFCFWVLIRWTGTWDFFDFLTTPPIWTRSKVYPLFSLESFSIHVYQFIF